MLASLLIILQHHFSFSEDKMVIERGPTQNANGCNVWCTEIFIKCFKELAEEVIADKIAHTQTRKDCKHHH